MEYLKIIFVKAKFKLQARIEMNKIKALISSKFENAQTMVEFALVFPLVLLITYGLIEFGRMIYITAQH